MIKLEASRKSRQISRVPKNKKVKNLGGEFQNFEMCFNFALKKCVKKSDFNQFLN